MNQETSIHQQDEFTLEEKIKYGILGVIVLGGSFFIGRKLVRRAKSYSEEKKTYEEGNEATYAKQLKMAFENDMWFGWGTDEEAIRKVLRAIPSKEYFRKVINSYQRLYSSSLMKDMQDELTSAEYNEMLAILSVKPERGKALQQPALTGEQFLSWAKREGERKKTKTIKNRANLFIKVFSVLLEFFITPFRQSPKAYASRRGTKASLL